MRAIILISVFLSGCNSFPTILPQERCFTVLDTENIEIIKGEPYYKGVCRCRMYEWNSSHIGPITEAVNKPLNYCDKFAGFSPDSTGTIYAWQEEVRLWLNRSSKKNR